MCLVGCYALLNSTLKHYLRNVINHHKIHSSPSAFFPSLRSRPLKSSYEVWGSTVKSTHRHIFIIAVPAKWQPFTPFFVLCAENSSRPFPSCWTLEQWEKFRHDYDWLFATDGKLGCTICRDVETLGPNRSVNGTRLQLSAEWCTGQVQPNGDSRQKEHRSLRKKIYIHRDSVSHQTAVSVMKTKNVEHLQTKFTDQQKSHFETTSRVFRTVYYIAKSNRPFADHPDLIDLQAANSANMGRMLHSNAEHIAFKMREKLVKAIIDSKLPFSVLIDKSTSLSQK